MWEIIFLACYWSLNLLLKYSSFCRAVNPLASVTLSRNLLDELREAGDRTLTEAFSKGSVRV